MHTYWRGFRLRGCLTRTHDCDRLCHQVRGWRIALLLRLAPLVLGGLLLSACAGAMGEGDQELLPIIVIEDSVETSIDDEFDRASLDSLEASEGDREPWPIIVIEDPAETSIDEEFDRASLVYPGSLVASEGAEGDEGPGETFRLYSTADDSRCSAELLRRTRHRTNGCGRAGARRDRAWGRPCSAPHGPSRNRTCRDSDLRHQLGPSGARIGTVVAHHGALSSRTPARPLPSTTASTAEPGPPGSGPPR